MNSSHDIFWIAEDPPPGLAIVLRPRGGDWLSDELARYKLSGIDTIVSMLEDGEAAELGLSEERSMAELAGLNFLSYAIPDRHTPANSASFRSFAEALARRAADGERIAFHCRGSIGRATVVAASVLIHLGWEPAQALEAIEVARGCQIPDTLEQREWVLSYEARA